MTIQEFAKLYNPINKCEVTYINSHGETVKGLALDKPVCGFSGYFLNVDNFANKISMRSVLSIRDTGKSWSGK